MKCECSKCDGDGETECQHCGSVAECGYCGGEGSVEECISTIQIPKSWKAREEIERLQADARLCRSQHEKLVGMNPRSKESYDRQLSATLLKLEKEAEVLRNA